MSEIEELKAQLNTANNIITEYRMFHLWFKDELYPYNRQYEKFRYGSIDKRISRIKQYRPRS